MFFMWNLLFVARFVPEVPFYGLPSCDIMKRLFSNRTEETISPMFADETSLYSEKIQ